MTPDRLTHLLAAAAQPRFSAREHAELAHLLEDPANRERADRELRAFKQRLGVLWDYQQAAPFEEPAIPEARLETLLAGLREQNKVVEMRPRRKPFRRWFGPLAAVAALAAGLTVVFWSPGTEGVKPGRFEFGVVDSVASTTVRGGNEPPGAALGTGWTEVKQQSLAALQAWSTGELPAGVAARVWFDEEAGLLRARYRRAEGSIATAERKLESEIPVPEQVRRFGASLPGAGGRP